MTATTRRSGLAIFIAVCLGAGGLGAIATTLEIDGWYRTLAKPTRNPAGINLIDYLDVSYPPSR